jgi:hypothetical protein
MDDHNGVYEGKRVSRSQLFDKESASETSEFDDVYGDEEGEEEELESAESMNTFEKEEITRLDKQIVKLDKTHEAEKAAKNKKLAQARSAIVGGDSEEESSSNSDGEEEEIRKALN